MTIALVLFVKFYIECQFQKKNHWISRGANSFQHNRAADEPQESFKKLIGELCISNKKIERRDYKKGKVKNLSNVGRKNSRLFDILGAPSGLYIM